MDYIFDLRNASFTNAKVEKISDTTYNVPITISSDVAAYDDFDTGTINPTLWEPKGTVTEGAYLGVNCLRVTGPASPTWDTDGVIMKPAITPTIGNTIITKAFLSDGGSFAIGLQEYDFTVDSIVTPTSWDLKMDTVQTTDNSTYVHFEAGRLSIVRGGNSGEIIHIPNTSWMVSDTNEVRPIYVSFIFTIAGFEIWVNQPSVWDAPKRVHVEIRSTNAQPTAGYSLCINKRYSDDTLGIYGIAPAFRDDGVISANVLLKTTDTIVYGRTLAFDWVNGGIAGHSGDVKVQFPNVSPRWLSLAELAADTVALTGALVHPVNFKLIGDVSIMHPITIQDEEPVT